jgi:transcriptional regulator with XRE-family HTH domain
VSDSHPLPSIDLDLVHKLESDPEYREHFFLAEASAEIARQLIKLRKRRGYSQTELAERAGTQQPAVSRAEQADYHNWSFNNLRKLTNAMRGRLRVVIDAWEDVLPEYYPDEHKPIVLAPRGSETEGASPKTERRGAPHRAASAAQGGEPPSSLLDGERRLNVVPEVVARVRQEKKRLEHGSSQWN